MNINAAVVAGLNVLWSVFWVLGLALSIAQLIIEDFAAFSCLPSDLISL